MSVNLEVTCACPLIFLDSIFGLFLLVVQGADTLIPPIIPDVMNQVLSIVKKSVS